MTCSFSKEFSSSSFVSIENIFITEYLPLSSGDAVKVFLYGLYMCQNPSFDQSLKDMAKSLNMSEQEVVDFFYYWEEFGLLSIISKEPFSVQYLPIRAMSSSKPRKYKAEKYSDFSKGIQSLLPDRMISTNEYSEYFSIMETYSIKPEAMLMIVKYCIDIKGQEISYRYISKVAKDFGSKGLNSVDKVEKELSSHIARNAVIEQIFKALSIRRTIDIEDINLFKKWTNELSFDSENIIFAASKLKKASMTKLDEFLLELYSLKSFSKQEIAEYMDRKKEIYDLAIRINKALSIYVEVIDTEIDTYIKKWLSYGFLSDALLFVASNCFKAGRNSLQDMDELISQLKDSGFISLSAVGDYFNERQKDDEFISKILLNIGLSRRPNPFDRENLSMWKKWNFSDQMILEASKLSAGKSSPMGYMNGILSNWKNNGIFSLNEVSDMKNADNSQENYNLEYEKRRAIALSRAQKNNEIAMEIDGFSDAYSRLNSIEKDLAFAEIANDEVALSKLEEEKKNLHKKVLDLLKTKNLSLRDLSPIYSCEKCNDTGYVGTHRCDCFNKK